ncbi:MAG: transcription factor S [Candidatus Aenigmarchaeota archaeon]|nr:transcription factor S [Candidatus Aenigmarchaeota archaeon]
MNLQFCDCKGILLPQGNLLKCRNCGKEFKKEDHDYSFTSTQSTDAIPVLENDLPNLPTMEKKCQKCGSWTAYYWLIQTRSSDEPPTQFFKCTSCSHTWREYK